MSLEQKAEQWNYDFLKKFAEQQLTEVTSKEDREGLAVEYANILGLFISKNVEPLLVDAQKQLEQANKELLELCGELGKSRHASIGLTRENVKLDGTVKALEGKLQALQDHIKIFPESVLQDSPVLLSQWLGILEGLAVAEGSPAEKECISRTLLKECGCYPKKEGDKP